ncbi:unnamed protein product [Owenia fusiformis]|uniref:Uncharacterized protein n=1 Tax=Owenia fusiformis TaxID=6347 RepID=A0A8J1XJP5_OWEFU|nr:unnamed protein product [Owenia fusiformis]
MEPKKNGNNLESKDRTGKQGKETQEDIKNFAETTMNEMLGWYGYEKICSGETEKLNLNRYERPDDESDSENEADCDVPRQRIQVKDGASRDVDVTEDGRKEEVRKGTSDLATQHQNLVSALTNGIVTAHKNALDGSRYALCNWCQKFGVTLYSLKTTNGTKKFCSEDCFTQCRRASFKKNKICDWCKHVRHTADYVEFQDGEQQFQFCSDKCLNQYKMNIFCYEAQEHLIQMQSKLETEKKSMPSPKKQGKEVLITPDLWTQSKQDKTVAQSHLMIDEAEKPHNAYPEDRIKLRNHDRKRARLLEAPILGHESTSTPQSEMDSRASSLSPATSDGSSISPLSHKLLSSLRDLPGGHGMLLKEALTSSRPTVVRAPLSGNSSTSAAVSPAQAKTPNQRPNGTSTPPLIQIPAGNIPPMFLPPGMPMPGLPLPPYPYPPYPCPPGMPGFAPPPTLMVPFPLPIPIPIPIPVPFPVKDGKPVLLPEFSRPSRCSSSSSEGHTQKPPLSSDIEIVRTNYLIKEPNTTSKDYQNQNERSPSRQNDCSPPMYIDRSLSRHIDQSFQRRREQSTERQHDRSPSRERVEVVERHYLVSPRSDNQSQPSPLSSPNSMKLRTEPCNTQNSTVSSMDYYENEAMDLSQDKKRPSLPERPLSNSSSMGRLSPRVSPRVSFLSDGKMVPHGLVLPIITPPAAPDVKPEPPLVVVDTPLKPPLDSKYSSRRGRILDAPQVPPIKKRNRSPSPERHHYRHDFRSAAYPKRKCFRPKLNKTKVLVRN